MVGVLAFNTDGTDHTWDPEEASYQHITTLKSLGQVLMPDVRHMREQVKVSNTNEADPLSVLILAVQMITETCKQLQYKKKIVLLTDARSTIQDADDMSAVAKRIVEQNIELVVLGVDFDDADYGFKEEDKDQLKSDQEQLLKQFCEDSQGAYGTLAEAIDELQRPRLKSTRPTPVYTGPLTLGNPEEYDDALTMEVLRYIKIMKAAPPSASNYVVREGVHQPTQSTTTLNGDEQSNGGESNLSAVRNARTYQVTDEDAPGGKKDVEMDELSKGYEYGRTAVHISESDRNVTTFETEAGLSIVGFVDKNQYQRYLDLSRSSMILPKKGDEKQSMALSALIHALYELESYAVARIVPKQNKEPKLILLSPHIEPDFECLYDVELPFAEDMRRYRFPPLDRVMTVSGKQLKVHRNLPSEVLLEAMSDYVDNMDLSKAAKGDEGEPAEYAAVEDVFNPHVHKLKQVIRHRAIYPDAGLPEPRALISKYAHPPEELVDQSKSALDRIIKAGEVKKVPPKARGKRWGKRDAPKPLSDLDVGALLAQDTKRKGKKIDPKNAIPEYKQILDATDDMNEVHEATKQLKFIIFDWVKHSFGDSAYGRAVEGVRVMRDELEQLEEPRAFNDFYKELKKKVIGGELGGDRKEMWHRLRVARLKPFSKDDSEHSDMTAEEAKAFMNPNNPI